MMHGSTWAHANIISQYGPPCKRGLPSANNANCANYSFLMPNTPHEVINLGMGDGSVRSLRPEALDFLGWSYLVGIDDGTSETVGQ